MTVMPPGALRSKQSFIGSSQEDNPANRKGGAVKSTPDTHNIKDVIAE